MTLRNTSTTIGDLITELRATPETMMYLLDGELKGGLPAEDVSMARCKISQELFLQLADSLEAACGGNYGMGIPRQLYEQVVEFAAKLAADVAFVDFLSRKAAH